MVKHTKYVCVTIAAAAAIWMSGAFAQHAGHQMPGQPSSPGPAASAEVTNACVQSSQQTLQLVDRANARLEAARQTNNPAEMRAAIDDLQAALVEMKTQLSGCLSVASSAGRPTGASAQMPNVHESHKPSGTPVMQPGAPTMAPGAPGGHSHTAPAQTPPAGPKDHSGMRHTTPAAPPEGRTDAESTVDPVCGMSVDPKTAPQATFQGKTYYFCSEADKEKFLKDPKSFVQNPSPR